MLISNIQRCELLLEIFVLIFSRYQPGSISFSWLFSHNLWLFLTISISVSGFSLHLAKRWFSSLKLRGVSVWWKFVFANLVRFLYVRTSFTLLVYLILFCSGFSSLSWRFWRLPTFAIARQLMKFEKVSALWFAFVFCLLNVESILITFKHFASMEHFHIFMLFETRAAWGASLNRFICILEQMFRK